MSGAYLLCSPVYHFGMPDLRPLLKALFKEKFMRPLHRRPVNKGRSAGKFRSQVGRTHSMNMKGAPMRGGIRL